eukprot:213177-Chlamydomonas_euryale.AAC.1
MQVTLPSSLAGPSMRDVHAGRPFGISMQVTLPSSLAGLCGAERPLCSGVWPIQAGQRGSCRESTALQKSSSAPR